ncbi:hypothetical protein L6164_017417 [Bauhinia variegata]|uniref:Uncharacterized protein n=1 Tax=Bauhinia variegata TaxID=167791 RepID=A0ACB9N9S9_BAUVA|nr:hypothetical protein L6164_017417 [Bauhinia variegata]
MEADEILKLYDYYWFELNILKDKPKKPELLDFPSKSAANPDLGIEEEASKSKISRIRTSHTRSMSDQLSSMASSKDDSFSPDSVLFEPKLQTILSGKEVTDPEDEITENQPQTHSELLPEKKIASRRRKKSGSKSLSDLEFEELKGFMDLGFIFSEEDKDSSLASIIPGLQRLGKKNEEEEDEHERDFDESAIQRPYLSEAWEVLDRRKKEDPLLNWRIPALNNETDIKNSLRWWAHAVASTVR